MTTHILRFFLFLIFVVYEFSYCYCQTFKLEREISLKANSLSVDNLGKIYAVNKDEILQFLSDGTLANRYSNLMLGEVSLLDVTNPLKLVVFYQNLSQLVFLDNTLSRQTEQISLETINYDQVTFVCSSINNGLWLFNQRGFQLVRLDERLKEVQKTINISQIIGKEINPVFMIERNNSIYLSDPKGGVFIFDIYGTYMKTIPLLGISSFQVIDDNLYFKENDSLVRYDLKTHDRATVALPDTDCKTAWVSRKKLFILTLETLKIYSIKM